MDIGNVVSTARQVDNTITNPESLVKPVVEPRNLLDEGEKDLTQRKKGSYSLFRGPYGTCIDTYA
jgi:hypothetical protein